MRLVIVVMKLCIIMYYLDATYFIFVYILHKMATRFYTIVQNAFVNLNLDVYFVAHY